jgi:hypothetical protein
MYVEEFTDDAALIRVKWVLLDVNTVPYVPSCSPHKILQSR